MSKEEAPYLHISDEPHIDANETGIHYVDGQVYATGGIRFPVDADRDEVREILADARGSEPEYIQFTDEIDRTAHGRRVTGFLQWNSSWDPHEQKGDPTLN